MKLSTRSQYGLKACFYLAENYGKGNLSVARLAVLSNVSEAYLEQLMILLRKGGLVVSERGATGGYALSRLPGDITAGEIVRALEDNLEIMDCLTRDSCEEKDSCPTCSVWSRLHIGINKVLDDITLAQMVSERAEGQT